MDLTAPLVFVSLFVLASISLFLVYKYGIKKKSFEEALAEHRKQTSALLANKPKTKEKKNKKAAKKMVKEKVQANISAEKEIVEEADTVESKEPKEVNKNVKSQPQSKSTKSSKQNKIHVEFKEEPEEVPAELPTTEKEDKEGINKKRVKKVRPILVKKSPEDEVILPTVETPVANHFEEIHPKDDFELLRANSREEVHKPEAPKEEKKPEKSSKKNKQHKQAPEQQHSEKNVVNEVATVEKEKPKEEKVVENVVIPVQEPVVNMGKEKKKKKSEFNAKQQTIAERDQLIHSVRNAELSRTEVQLLIDLLLNKQLEAPAVIDDWSEGKSDPVQKLKKQLAEKEKLLADEQEALVGVQAKLKEVRNEQLLERAQLQQKLRASEESKIEIVAAHNRLQQKIQELEDFRNKDLANLQRLVEDNKALQMQRTELENTLVNYQETEAYIMTLKNENAHLSNDLQLLTQERQEQVRNYQNCVVQIQALQEELRVTKEYVVRLERDNGALIMKNEESLKLIEQLKRAAENHVKEEQKLKEVITQLTIENKKLSEENSGQVNGSASDDSKDHEVKVLNLTNELSSVKSQLTSVSQTLLEAERQYKSELSNHEDKYEQLKVELEEQKSKNDELRKKNWKVIEALNAAESRSKSGSNKTADVNIDQLASEIRTKEQNAQKEFIERLFPEIDSLKSVSSGGDWQSECEKVIRRHICQLQDKPEAVSSPASGDEVTKLQTQVQHYKKIIDETEGMLRKLESHIEQEERKWRSQLSQKDAEIQELKNSSSPINVESEPDTPESNGIQFAYKCIEKSLPVIIDELQVKVSTLESQLAREQADKVRLLEERQVALDRPEVKTVLSDSTATIEKLSEEINRLRDQLRIEQIKNNEAVKSSEVCQNGEAS